MPSQAPTSMRLAGERIEHWDAASGVVADVPRGDCQAVVLGRREEVAVRMRRQQSAKFQGCEQFAPDLRHRAIEGERARTERSLQLCKPEFQALLPSPVWKPGHTPLDFSEHEGAGEAVRLVRLQPSQHTRVRPGFRSLAENICVEQIVHRLQALSAKRSRANFGSDSGQARSTLSQLRARVRLASTMRPSPGAVTCSRSPACRSNPSSNGLGSSMVPCLVNVVCTLQSNHNPPSLSTREPAFHPRHD